jgi:hypothetical protein
MRWLASAVAVMCLVGCKGPYHAFDGTSGFSEAPVASGRYEVGYVGTSSVSPTDARYYATVRAAELAWTMNKPAFRILDEQKFLQSETQVVPGNQTVTSVDAGKGRRGGTRQVYVSNDPGYVRTYAVPSSTLQVELLDAPAEGSLDPKQVIQQAHARGVELSPAIRKSFGWK